ncbi:hypothetical protein GFS31_01890 [Leptolyngbya sp. BL0902]|nr:hypothetical protein GFS31_01890 [Leptolyngbya sp. BL0902]
MTLSPALGLGQGCLILATSYRGRTPIVPPSASTIGDGWPTLAALPNPKKLERFPEQGFRIG